MKRWINGVWALVAVVTMAAPALAQGGGASSTGSISGEIKDAQGGVLPGVTVTATSPAQIGALTAVTNEAGLYRFPAVPPGEYRLAYELAGFQGSVRDGIRITLGFNGQVNVTLNVATLQETVTVSPACGPVRPTATREVRACLESDLTELNNYNWKIQYAPFTSNTITFQNTWAEKVRNARDASVTRPIETTYRQKAVSTDFGAFGCD